MDKPNVIRERMREQMKLITKQEIEWLSRVEKVLELPKGKLVNAVIRDRMLTVIEGLETLVGG